MDREVNDIRRRTWAPFVGAALAALTAGSLVVFSLVAQRTSLDGFPELRIATPSEVASGRPASITVAPLGGDNGSTEVESSDVPASGELADVTEPATSLALIPLVPATVPPALVDIAVLDDPAGTPLNAARNRQPRTQQNANFDGAFRAEGVLLTAGRDGRAEEDGRGKHAGKSDDAKSKKNKNKNKNKKKNKKQKRANNHGTTHRRSRGRAHAHGPQGTSHSATRGASSGSQNKSHRSAAPRPAPSPQGPPAHSNAGGNGKSNGKGHKKH